MRPSALKRKIARITALLEDAFGNPCWDGARAPLDLLIQTILSQNTSDRNSRRAFRQLKEAFPTWDNLLAAPLSHIRKAIKTGGLANQKSIRIRSILRWLQKEYGRLSLDFVCKMPTAEVYEKLSQLKGVGVKTISVMLLFACGRDVFPVDTHVHRTTRQLGLVPTDASAEKAHQVMSGLVPPGKSYSLHLNLIHLGRTVCKPRNPECLICPLRKSCHYYRATIGTTSRVTK